MKKTLLLVFWIVASTIVAADDCADWDVGINQSSKSLCTPQTLSLDAYARHDSLQLTTCTYEWYVKSPSENAFVRFSQSQSTTYAFNDPGDYYVFATISPNSCSAINTDTIVVVRYKNLDAGKIEGSSTICYGLPAGPIRISNSPSGGDGIYAYQWQSKTDGDWVNIPSATTTTYNPGILTETTAYRLVVTNTCSTAITNEVLITVRPELTAPVVSDYHETICYGTAPSQLTIQTLATGGFDDTFLYQWQESADGTTYNDIPSATGVAYQPAAITSARWYRVIATSQLGCGSVESSNATKVSVYPKLQISTTGTSPLCYMTPGQISVSATGAGDVFTYQWQESSDGTSFTSINNVTTNVYTTAAKPAGMYYYRCIVSPTNACAPDTSDVISVQVYAELNAGKIEGSSTICYGSPADSIRISNSPSGGDGSYTYMWQYKTTGNWIDIPSATTTTYNPGVLTETTAYRLVVTNTCSTAITNEVLITVRPKLTAPVVSDYHETICYGTAPSQLTIQTLATGGFDDTFLYQWQESADGTTYNDIPSATGVAYQPAAITSARWYRVIATSQLGCGSVESSNATKVSVYPKLQISTTGTSPLCYMTPGQISVSATGAGDVFTYQWQESSDGTSFTSINNVTTNVYTTAAKPAGMYYYRCIVSPTNACAPDTSDVISVQVYAELNAGTIVGADTICFGYAASPIQIASHPSGGDGTYTYRWMQRPEGTTTYTYIAGTESTTPQSYSPSVLYKTTEYQLEITNACGVVYTNSVRIFVRDQLVAPIINCVSDTICYQTMPEIVEMTSAATGGVDDSFTYQWEESVDGRSFAPIAGETAKTYQPGVLSTKHYYRLSATSVQGCGVIYSNIIEINVFDDMIISISPSQNLCYMDVAHMSVSVVGGGDEYNYQWQVSTDNISYQDISCVMHEYTSQPLAGGTYYYRCIVTSTKCSAYSKTSEPIIIKVYTDIQVGELGTSHEVCYGEDANPLVMITPTTGSILDDVKYIWWVLLDGESEWKKVAETKLDTYTPQFMTQSSQYRLQLVTICDTVYTNPVYIKVNPLPEVQEVVGANNVCYNQYENYFIDIKDGFTYNWTLKNNHGTIISKSDDMSSVEILWQDANTKDSVLVTITNEITGCVQEVGELISICNESAPDRTIVVRKPSSNILVAQASAELFYQWGYTNRMTQEDQFIDDSNRRYVLLPHPFDNQTNEYWLLLRTVADSPCYSKSVYVENNDALISTPNSTISVPSFVNKEIPISVQNSDNDQVVCNLYTIDGVLIATYNLGVEQLINTHLPFAAPQGMYILNVQVGNMVETFKLIAQ